MKKPNSVYPVLIPVLITIAVLTGMRACFTVYDISVKNRLYNHLQLSVAERTFYNTQLQVRQWLFIIAGIIYTVLFCMWLYQEYKNVRTINNGNTRYKLLLAAFSPVIPLFNLFAPLIVMNEMWDTYCNNIMDNTEGKGLVKQWFFLFVVVMIFNRILSTILNKSSSEDTDLLYFNILLYLIQIHYFIITIRLVKKINAAGDNYDLYTRFLEQENKM